VTGRADAGAVRVRRAVADALAERAPQGPLVVAVSGGADSLALAWAVSRVAPERARAVVVDHRLQPDSDAVAAAAADTVACLGLGVEVRAVDVGTVGGPEAAARTARYAALTAAAAPDGAVLLLGHTRDDQAETVLLGLARGSGTRSLAGMAGAGERDGIRYLRPLLDLTRADTAATCAAVGLSPWQDPHNSDPRYTRSRARALLAELEAALGPGIGAALARTARLARDDADALDALAVDVGAQVVTGSLGDGRVEVDAAALARCPAAVRRRVLRRAAIAAGSPPGSLTADHLERLDAFVADWHGQGPAALPGPVTAERACGRLTLSAAADPI
jgi:tRNA(Ile)-lysidine synthetase-like protein